MRRLRRLVATAAGVMLGSCDSTPRGGPMVVSIVQPGAPRGPSPLDLAVCQASGRGLVRLDAAGQVVPDLAARWAIDDDGQDYIFRLEDGIAPRSTVRQVRALLASSRNAIRPWLAPIAHVEAVTSTVVEIRLASPMPDLLTLLARPEMTLTDTPGPMRAVSTTSDGMTLAPRAPADDAPERMTLHGERAGRAVARFAAGKADAVLGGTFFDLPVANAAALPAGTLVRDPAAGLFGLAVRSTAGAAVDRAITRALSLAIDRDRILALVGGGEGRKATTIAGSTLEPPLAQRVAAAQAAIAMPLTVRVALPDGPGARLLFALIAQDWRRIGVTAVAVAADAPADLALVDLVVPPGEIARVACAVSAGCDQRDPQALLDPTFIPLLQPIRWSLVAPAIGAFPGNALAAHPLDQLRRRH